MRGIEEKKRIFYAVARVPEKSDAAVVWGEIADEIAEAFGEAYAKSLEKKNVPVQRESLTGAYLLLEMLREMDVTPRRILRNPSGKPYFEPFPEETDPDEVNLKETNSDGVNSDEVDPNEVDPNEPDPDKLNSEKSPNEKLTAETSPNEKTPNEKTPNEKTPNEKTPNEKTPNEKTPNEKTPNEKTPNEKKHAEKSPAVDFSISHDGNIVTVVLSFGGSVGVDLMKLPARTDVKRRLDIIRRIASEEEIRKFEKSPNDEQMFGEIWTRREAYSKYIGGNLACVFGRKLPKECDFFTLMEKEYILSVCAERLPGEAPERRYLTIKV